MNMKIADFGFSREMESFGTLLKTLRGTLTYMAPEIKEGRPYDGREADIFSVGVIIFIIVLGIFPFQEARKEEYFYKLLVNGNFPKYWNKVGGETLSNEFKDLIQSMFSFKGSDRPKMEDLINHPWMSSSK